MSWSSNDMSVRISDQFLTTKPPNKRFGRTARHVAALLSRSGESAADSAESDLIRVFVKVLAGNVHLSTVG